jgi:hypothetical protein
MNKPVSTHQQRWRARLRETHDRLDVYLPKTSAAELRLALPGDETVSAFVERMLKDAMRSDKRSPDNTGAQPNGAPEQALAPETLAYAALRAQEHGVSVDDFMLAAMRGVASQTKVMIHGLAKAGRRDAVAAVGALSVAVEATQARVSVRIS